MINWSALDFERFGLKTAKLNITSHSQELRKKLDYFIQQRGQLFIVRCKSNLKDDLFFLQNQGFIITDTMLTFSADPFQISNNQSTKSLSPNVTIEIAGSNAIKTIAELAQKSFSQYEGHYHKNLFLDKTKCSEIYVDWAQNMCMNKQMADVVFLAKAGTEPVGFASLKQNETNTAQAGLLGVLPEWRNSGVAQKLHQARFEWCKNLDIRKLNIETSLNNYPYINLLQKLKFQLESSIHILHLNNK